MNKLLSKLKERLLLTFRQDFWKQLITNMSTALVAEIGVTVLGFIVTAIIIRTLGNHSYGIFTLVLAFANTATRLTSLQTWQGVIKFGSEALVKENPQRLESILKISLLTDFIMTFIGIIVAWNVAGIVGSISNWDQEIISFAKWISLLLIVNLSGTPTGLLRILNQFKLITAYRLLAGLVKLILVLLFIIVFDLGVFGIIIAYIIGEFLGIFYLYSSFIQIVINDDMISMHGILGSPIKLEGKSFLRFSFLTNLTSITDIPSKEFDAFILSTISFEIVAVFKVYKQIGQVLYKLVNPLSQAILPQFSELVAQNRRKECYQKMTSLRNKSILILVPLTILLSVGSLLVLYILFGKIYLTYWYVLLSYLLARSFALASASIHPLFIAFNYVKKNVFFSIIANLSYMGLALVLTRYIGIMGIVAALAAEYIIMIGLKTLTLKKEFDNSD